MKKKKFLLPCILVMFTFATLLCGCELLCQHEWSEAKCESSKVCTLCGKVDGDPLGHNWIAPTCETPMTCERCNVTDGEALGHTWTDPTCETPKTCSVCQKTDGAPLGHSWDVATCENPQTCSVCQKTEGAPLGHIWNSATCETPKTCSVCSKTEGAPLGHVWSPATCESPKTCSTCFKTEGIALGHIWSPATCILSETCSVCKKTQGNPLGHMYDETVTRTATCSAAGTKKFDCSVCSHSYTESYSLTSYTASEIHDMYTASIGEIITYNKNGSELALGSCFAYSTDGKIITNFHVIEDAYSANVTINGKTYTVQYVLAYDRDIDLAVLQINASGLNSVKICNGTHKVGASVYAFGSSKGLTATFSQGIITYSNREISGVVYTQHDAAISSGNSGGPLINEYGEVIGINTMTIKESQNLNFAINTSELSNLDFSTKLTMAQFYEKECDTFTKIKNYIIQNGTYNYENNYYIVTLGYVYSSNYVYKYTRYAYYYVSEDYITLDLSSKSSSSLSYVYFTITDVDGSYAWEYFDDDNYKMSGTIYATTYTKNTLLGYTYNNIYYSSMRTSVRELASAMVSHLLSYLDNDFASIGVSAEDLGFYYY